MPRTLPFIQQPIDGQSWICLASCIAMVLEDLGRPIDQIEIASHFLVPVPNNPSEKYCDNLLALKYVLNLGLTAAFIAVDNPIAALKACKHNSIYSVLSMRVEPTSNAHSVLFCDMDSKYVYINDPLLSKDLGCGKSLSRNFIRECMQKQERDQQIIHSYTMLIISSAVTPENTTYTCPLCKREVPAISELRPFIKYFLCPNADVHGGPTHWVAFSR